MILSAGPLASAGHMDHSAWWIRNFQELAPGDDPLAARAMDVFSRVSAAADKAGNRTPKLVILKSRTNPWAVAIKDGAILVSQGALAFCYQGTSGNPDLEAGDSRLAFVLGHELAHLAKDDFWHMSAFSALRGHGDNASQALQTLLGTTGDTREGREPRSDRKIKELRADAFGLLYMAMAGYDPDSILAGGPNGFFREWVQQVTGDVAYDDPAHPHPDRRARFAAAQLNRVAADLAFFRFGVRLLQTGRYKDGILLLEAFQELFPSREVFNNIGIGHYHLAMNRLAACDAALASRFYLPLRLDENTLADPPGPDRSGGDCQKDPVFIRHIRAAQRFFAQAVEKDPFYIPGRINLASTLIMAGRYARAVDLADEVLADEVLADEALAHMPGHAEAGLLKAVGLYLLGRDIGADTTDPAIKILKEILTQRPDWAPARYNLARIQAEAGQTVAGESRLHYPHRSSAAPPMQSPIPLGDLTTQTKNRLAGLKKREFTLGGIDGAFYTGDGIDALELDYSLDMVVMEPVQLMEGPELKTQCGRPRRVVENQGSRTWVYDSFAVDIRSGRVRKWLFYQPRSEGGR